MPTHAVTAVSNFLISRSLQMACPELLLTELSTALMLTVARGSHHPKRTFCQAGRGCRNGKSSGAVYFVEGTLFGILLK